ncbi:MAG: hypothetical protein JNM28_02235 [Armatimonadetes bacterium]|nr:hypothetical protein [Armatimonadota bacterium]MBS1711909.1 hypothetical protein [Armatimonadota bacterium]MBX3109537.1 hypothetical protein [Fimbriimonadaceae bacterium]
MDGAFWVVFAVAALLCGWLEAGDAPGSRGKWPVPAVALVGLGVLVLAAKQGLGADLSSVPPLLFGGIALCLALHWWRPDSVYGLAACGALAAQSLAASSGASDVSGMLLNPVFFVFLAAGWVGAAVAWGGNSAGGTAFAATAALTKLADYWTPEGFGKTPHMAGTLLATAVVASAILAVLLRRGKQGAGTLLTGGLASILVTAAAFFIGKWGGDDSTLPVTVFASAAAAFVVCWMSGGGGGSRRGNQVVLGGLIWMGVATLAFAQDGTFGLGMAGLTGVACYLLLGRADLASTVAPLAALAFYRMFRLEYPETTRAFDIAQHYGMVGLMIGAGLMVLLLGMPRLSEQSGIRNWARFGVLSLMAAGATVVGLQFFGVKGGVGLIVGLGLGTWMAGVAGKKSAGGLPAFAGLCGLVGLSYAKASETFEMTRDEKMSLFVWASAGLAALTIVTVLFLTDRESEVPVEAAELA